jgi:hypothetical protein
VYFARIGLPFDILCWMSANDIANPSLFDRVGEHNEIEEYGRGFVVFATRRLLRAIREFTARRSTYHHSNGWQVDRF